jgi:hypothetical protein
VSSPNLPVLFNASGPVTTPPATLLVQLTAVAASFAPGYTNALPGSLIEDISSTDVGAMISCDQARVDAINNVTPYGANAYVLAQQGLQLGFPQGLGANGNAFEVFSGPAGYVIGKGFLVGDGTNQYAVQDGGTIGTNGQSPPLYVVATNSNTFAIPANSITTIITSVPSPYTITCTNPLAGNPAAAPETVESYRSRLLIAQQGLIQGVNDAIKTALLAVPGVAPLQVSVIQSGIYWEVICGGGDPFEVAGAIYQSVSTVGLLTGSSVSPTRNVNVSLISPPNTYEVVYVNPPQQILTFSIIWNTQQPNFTAGPAVNQYMITAAIAYGNSIQVGQPINLLVLQELLQTAVTSVLPLPNLTTLLISATINGVAVSPGAGTSIIASDPESYFFVAANGVSCTQG